MSYGDLPLPAPSPSHARCPGCGEKGLTDVFQAVGQPPLVGVLYDGEEEARSAATGDIVLAFCHACALVHNRSFDPGVVDFAPGYEVSLAHSATFAGYIDGLADRLVDRYSLAGRRVLEIGCGSGHFLRLLARRGIREGVGMDPTLATSGPERIGDAELTWLPDYFDPSSWERPLPDLVCCLSVLESVSRPAEFLVNLHELLVDAKTPVYFEVFNAAHAFEQGETWSVHYEQSNYFHLSSLVGLFERCGFEIRKAEACYEGDQYVFVEAVPGIRQLGAATPPRQELSAGLRGFAQKHGQTVRIWERRLEELGEAGRSAVVWGSGGKGISFLNTIPAAEQIAYVVDINPDRQGRHVPRAGQLIVAPEALVDVRPDVIVITNPLYDKEIRRQVADLGLTCQFLVA